MSTRKLQEARSTEAEAEADHKRGWTPRRFGVFYCSPRCGAHCTRAAFETATRKAAALAKRLGPGWEPNVWENMGWFYSVSKGVATVHANRYKAYPGGVCYSVYLNTARQFVTEGKSPEDALRLATTAARLAVRKINRDLRAVAA